MNPPREFPDELPEVRSLPREAELPPALEDRVVGALRRQGLLGAPRRRGLRPLLAAAAAVLLFAGGFLAGRDLRPAPAAALEPTYALLLREGPAFQHAADTEQVERRVEEYRAWAMKLQDAGVTIRGEKLKDDILLVVGDEQERVAFEQAAQQAPGPVAGFFLIEARSLEQALRLARGCPHLRYGGTIEVRPIDTI